MNSLQLDRKQFITKLASIKEPNVTIGDIVIDRQKLLAVLRLQNHEDILTLAYGKVSWKNGKQYDVYEQPCIQFNCNHTTFRFLNRPRKTRGYSPVVPETKPLNFVDHRNNQQAELTGIVIDTQQWLKALSFVIPCMEKNEYGRPNLQCVLFDSGNDTIKLVTADGFRLGHAELPAKDIPAEKVMIVNTDIVKLVAFLKSIKPIGKGKSKYYPDIFLTYQDKSIKFATTDRYLELEKSPLKFPDYERLIPQHGTHIEVIASDMLQAVKAVSTTAKDGSGIIRLQFTANYPIGKVTISSKSEEIGDTTADCQAKVERDCKIAVNQKYLIDCLSQCKDNLIDLFITRESNPIVIHNNIDQFQVVMPMQVVWNK